MKLGFNAVYLALQDHFFHIEALVYERKNAGQDGNTF
jgi:hypothetical protein